MDIEVNTASTRRATTAGAHAPDQTTQPLPSIPKSRDGSNGEPTIADSAQAAGTVADPAEIGDADAVSRDRTDWGKDSRKLVEYLLHARKKSGRPPMELAREFFRLHRGRGKLTWQEYVQYGVYDTTRHSREDQTRFIANDLHWPITDQCSDQTWKATTEDKWLCSHILENTEIRIAQTRAVIDRTDRAYPGTHKIATAAQLRDFVQASGSLPVFGKENSGICGFGAFLAVDANDEALLLKGEGWLGYDVFMDRFVGATPYILQSAERNHGFFDRYTETLATVRACVLVADDGIKIPFAVLKLPSRENVVDHFWRPGNLACNIDVHTGRILTARSKDRLGTTDYATHPETDAPLVGEAIPMWDRVVEMVEKCSPIFQPVRYQSMDIGITQDGPVLIEINTGGGFDLPQLASGEGFLTDEVCDFFRSCGYHKV